MVTLKDIAARANLSVTTVSKVVNFNDTSVCSEDTKKLIWSLVDSMGYKPKRKEKRDIPAITGNVYRIAYVMRVQTYELSSTYLYKIIRGIEEETVKRGAMIPFSCLNLDLYTPEALCDQLEEAGVGAVLWISAINEAYFSVLCKRGIRIVLTGVSGVVPEHMDYVGVNYYSETLRWLKSKILGRFNKIGYIGTYDQPQYEAFIDAHKLTDRPLDRRFIIGIDDDLVVSAKKAVRQFLESNAELPDVFFAARDALAIGALHTFQDQGIAIPEKLKLVGFDNIELADYMSPGLTTIGVPAFEIGRHAVAAAVSLLQLERDYPVHHLFTTSFLERGTF